jgi:hypothetical protein
MGLDGSRHPPLGNQFQKANKKMSLNEETGTPLILQCHIPKTAGTTISENFRKSFGIYHFHHLHPDPYYILTRDVLEDFLQINPFLRCITSHHLRSFPLSIANRATFFFTFLRRPEEAFISTLRFAQREFFMFPPEVRRLWPKDTTGLPLRELARQYLEMNRAFSDISAQTRFFCSPRPMAEFGLSDGHDYGLNSAQIAFSILREFHFVGIVDEMKKSLELLTDLLLQRGVRAYFDLRLRLNTSADRSRPAWLTPEDEVGSQILATNRSDRLLYDYFRNQVLESHRDLRKRRWLGFKPAAADLTEQSHFGWRSATRSFANSARLYYRRHAYEAQPSPVSELSSDLLEFRAARAFLSKEGRPSLLSDPGDLPKHFSRNSSW